MSYWYAGSSRNETDRERYLAREVERLEDERREAQERRWREEDEARQRRQDEIRQRVAEHERSASSWPEALQKQIRLAQREVDLDDPELGDEPLFGPFAASCERALELWEEAEAGIADEVAALQARINELNDSVRLSVADRLEAEANGRTSWGWTVNSLRDSDPESFLNW